MGFKLFNLYPIEFFQLMPSLITLKVILFLVGNFFIIYKIQQNFWPPNTFRLLVDISRRTVMSNNN